MASARRASAPSPSSSPFSEAETAAQGTSPEPAASPSPILSPPSPTGLFSGTSTPTPALLDDQDYESDSLLDEPQPAPAAPATSSPLSATDKRTLERALGEGFQLLGRGLHGLVANPVEQEFDLYLLDDDDASGLAKPATSLLVRHGNIPGGPDLGDILRILVALAAYIGKQAKRRLDARRYLEDNRQPEPTETSA